MALPSLTIRVTQEDGDKPYLFIVPGEEQPIIVDLPEGAEYLIRALEDALASIVA